MSSLWPISQTTAKAFKHMLSNTAQYNYELISAEKKNIIPGCDLTRKLSRNATY